MKRAYPVASEQDRVVEPTTCLDDGGTSGQLTTSKTVRPDTSVAFVEDCDQPEDALSRINQATVFGSGYTNIPGFLTKTYEIFSNSSFSKLCGWGVNGDTIVIYKIPEFASEVLPQYFKHSNFQSFVRQLNMYNFHKTVQDPTHGEFQHQYFRKGRPDLLTLIKRKAGTPSTTASGASTASGSSGSTSSATSKSTRTSVPGDAGGAGAGSGGGGNKGAAAPSSGGRGGGGGAGSGGGGSGSTPLARAMAEAWPQQKDKITTHTDAVITELVQLQHWARHMEHRIQELDAQNRHLTSANDTLWKSLQRHSASQLQMQTKMQKIIYFLYHAVLTPEAKSQLSQLEENRWSPDALINDAKAVAAQSAQPALQQQHQSAPPPQQQHMPAQQQLQPAQLAPPAQQQQQQHLPFMGASQSNTLFAESLKFLNMEMPGILPMALNSGILPSPSSVNLTDVLSGSGGMGAMAGGGGGTTMQQLMQQLASVGNSMGGANAAAMLGATAALTGPGSPGGDDAFAGHDMLMASLAAAVAGGSMGGAMGGGMGCGGEMGGGGGMGGDSGGGRDARHGGGGAPMQSSHQQQHHNHQQQQQQQIAAAAASTLALGQHPGKRARVASKGDKGDRGDDFDMAALVSREMENLGAAEAETFTKLGSLESHLSSLFDGEDLKAMLSGPM